MNSIDTLLLLVLAGLLCAVGFMLAIEEKRPVLSRFRRFQRGALFVLVMMGIWLLLESLSASAASGDIPGTTVMSPITTGNSNATYSIGNTREMQGTCKSVADLTVRDAITAARRTEGMKCWVISTSTEYRLTGGIANGDWVDITSTGGQTNLALCVGGVFITVSPATNSGVTTFTFGTLFIPQIASVNLTNWSLISTGAVAMVAGTNDWTGSNYFVGPVAMDSLTLTNGLTNLTLTASTVLAADGGKRVSSLPNGTGALTNDGSGTFGWIPLSAGLGQSNLAVVAASASVDVATNAGVGVTTFTPSLDASQTNSWRLDGTNAATWAAAAATNGYPWGSLYDAFGAATAATNGYPWGTLYDAAGSSLNATQGLNSAEIVAKIGVGIYQPVLSAGGTNYYLDGSGVSATNVTGSNVSFTVSGGSGQTNLALVLGSGTATVTASTNSGVTTHTVSQTSAQAQAAIGAGVYDASGAALAATNGLTGQTITAKIGAGVYQPVLSAGGTNYFLTMSGTAVTTFTTNISGSNVTWTASLAGGGAVVATTNSLAWLSFDQTAGSGLTNVVVDFSLGTEFALILTTNAFFTTPTNRPLTNWTANGTIRFYQDTVGVRSVSFTNGATPGAWKTPGAQTLVCTTNAGAGSLLSYTLGNYGTNQWYVWGLNFQ